MVHHITAIILTFSLVGFSNSGINLAYAAGNEEPTYNAAKEFKSAKRLVYKEKYKAALKKLQGIIDEGESDDDAEVWNLIGFSARKSGQLGLAAAAYETALEIEPKHKGALEYQGELFITLGLMDKAQINLNTLTKLCPSGCDEQIELAAAVASATQ